MIAGGSSKPDGETVGNGKRFVALSCDVESLTRIRKLLSLGDGARIAIRTAFSI
jgi:hypothetical protein